MYTPSDEETRFFAANGYLVTPALWEPEALEDVRAEIVRCWRERAAALARATGRGAAGQADFARVRPELQRLHVDSPRLSSFCRSPELATIARALIGDDVDLSWNQAYTKIGGGDPRTAIPWHQDAYYAEVDGPTYNCWVAITHCTAQNGTIVRADAPPGVLLPHVWDEELLFYRCEIDPSIAAHVELEPGQAFIFTGRVPHRSGVNVSSDERVSYSISFTSSRARLRANGETFGDRVPVVRGGRLVKELLTELATCDAHARTGHPGRAILDELVARAPRRRDFVHDAFEAFAASVYDGEHGVADRRLGELLAVLPDSDDVLGDLVRARARVDQLLRELRTIRGTDPRAERLLVQRALELDPSSAEARAEWTRLEA